MPVSSTALVARCKRPPTAADSFIAYSISGKFFSLSSISPGSSEILRSPPPVIKRNCDSIHKP